MKLLVYSAKDFEIPFLKKANKKGNRVTYTKDALDTYTAIKAVGFEAISIFAGDDACLVVLEKLRDLGVKYITIRAVGYNNIHLKAAKRFGLSVANTPDYSPHAIAEHAAGLLLALNRKIVVAYNQVCNYNFVQNNLLGFNLQGKTIGIIGTGRIGKLMIKIMHGFGCNILALDLKPDISLVQQYGVTYTDLEDICSQSDIISLHVPLTHLTHYMIDEEQLKSMKKDAVLINTARGSVVNTKALIQTLEINGLGGYATDVYEKEKGTFFKDNSKKGITDNLLKKLISYPNVLLTPHQAFMTKEALTNIAEATFFNIDSWAKYKECKNELGYETLVS